MDLLARYEALERRRDDLLAELARLPAAAIAARPEPGSWSLLEVAEHLRLVEDAMLWTATRSGARHRPAGRRHALLGALTRIVLRSRLRVPAPVRRIRPGEVASLDAVRASWLDVADRWRAHLGALTGLAARERRFVHPTAGPLDARGALEILVLHFDHRHQIERIRRSAPFAAAGGDR